MENEFSRTELLLGKQAMEKLKSADEDVEFKGKNPAPGSIAFVPSVAGLIIASEVIKDLTANLH